MSDSKEVLSRYSLEIQGVLQRSADHTVWHVKDPGGNDLVLKVASHPCPSFLMETRFLKSVQGKVYSYLVFPRIVASGERFLLMTFVDRTTHTRDSILQYDWTSADIERFHGGLTEFQSFSLPRSWFGLKQNIMGMAYPAFRLALQLPRAVSYRILRWQDVIPCLMIGLGYLLIRPTFRNVATHYDLTTKNYAFSGNDKMSLLDLEVSYRMGDPLFDATYFATIPTVRIESWTFQKMILLRQMRAQGLSWTARHRLRTILLINCVARALYFRNEPANLAVRIWNIRFILDSSRFHEWFSRLRDDSSRAEKKSPR